MKKVWTGDDGRTRLFGGEVTTKDSMRVDAYGDVDELNCYLGLVRSSIDDREISDMLKQVQKDLFVVGAELAKAKGNKSRVTDEQIFLLEKMVEDIEKQLPELNRFILPSGSPFASLLHISRSICRRAERKCVSLKKDELVGDNVIKYLNRLSSLLFSLARLANKKSGAKEEEW